jgi:hypothetical protein
VPAQEKDMTPDEAMRCDIGSLVEYLGKPVTITHTYRYQGIGRDAYRVSYHVRAANGTDYRHIDSRLLTSLSLAR